MTNSVVVEFCGERARLVEHAIAARIVTRADLPLVESVGIAIQDDIDTEDLG